ncbi:MAG TPA: carbamoyltransferase [Flavitalea sp.]|nr:carbamoyltransferase [Flavitalea sp.]
MAVAILGISAYYHDSAAVLLLDGKIVAAAQEERFTRIRHDASFPSRAIEYALRESGLPIEKINAVTFYEKPFIKFERLLETYHAFAPAGVKSFVKSMPTWIKEKMFLKSRIRNELSKFGKLQAPLYFPEHHLSHAASAFYPSPFGEAAVLTVDGVGEWATTTICRGEGNSIELLKELHFPHSVGLLYSAFTYYIGFRVNSGEYKLMGLAPYGNADAEQTKLFRKKIVEELVDLRADGSLLLNMEYFEFATGLRMTNDAKWATLFGLPARKPESEITAAHMNLALAIQQVTESILVKLAVQAKKLTGSVNLVMAGGVALNCVANSKIIRVAGFNQCWIQPAAGDAGGALGAALAVWHISMKKNREYAKTDGMQNSLLGPSYGDMDVERMIRGQGAIGKRIPDLQELCNCAATLLAEGKVLGWFQGKMEFGPRALGNRSILGDPRNAGMQKKINLSIKFREGFRPFAPAVLEEDAPQYFDCIDPSPYMLTVASLLPLLRHAQPEGYENLSWQERLYHQRSDIPAVTHIDYSARLQTVNKESHSVFHQLLSAFKSITGVGMLVNTSFNVRGEPIVCTPQDAYRCFMSTEMDCLVIGNFIFRKEEQ